MVYEVVWHRYLAILLGAQARATALVLAVFLGGIAAGYACFGRWTRWKKWNLLRVYALVELGLFAWAAFFPLLFRWTVPWAAEFYRFFGLSSLFIDLFFSVLLIGFPTFLMGGTLPLLTQGLSEDLKSASRTHAHIYGINTLGACFGCLGAGYFLIPTLGLVGATWFAALLNLMVAVIAFLVYARKFGTVSTPDRISRRAFKVSQLWTDWNNRERVLLAIGLLSGFYLITLQTVIIRLVGLSTGSSNYNFALVVSIFIFALGMGSLLARRIVNYQGAQLFWNQLGVAAGFLLLYLTASQWSYWSHVLRVLFRDLPQAFFPYELTLGMMFGLLFILPIGMAGLTLPLCFHLLKDRRETLGHRVGQLYGLNSVGCVLGALVGGYLLLYPLNLDQLFKVCSALALLGALLASSLYFKEAGTKPVRVMAVTGLSVLIFIGILVAPLLPKERFIQPFRQSQVIHDVSFEGAEAFGRHLARNTEMVFYKDGPNTSVGVGTSSYQGKETSRTIFINGKSDGNTMGDLFTTVVLAHLPGLLAPSTEKVCIIGFGTGITTGTMALYDGVNQIDVAEISGTVIANAGLFDNYNHGASKHPKVKFHEMDAFRFLGGDTHPYDVIISEPSNPWVAGVENLFSHEFYQVASHRLSTEGMLVQWIHTYAFNDQLLRMALKTIHKTFPYISVYQLRYGDLALVATKRPIDRADMKRGTKRIQQQPLVRAELAASGINRIETLLALEMVTPPLVDEMSENGEIHTLEIPRLSNGAARAFFSGTAADLEKLRRTYKGFYISVRESQLVDYLQGRMPDVTLLRTFKESFCEHPISRVNALCEETRAALHYHLTTNDKEQGGEGGPNDRELANLADFATPSKGKFTRKDLQLTTDMFDTYKRYYSPVAYLPIAPVLDRLDRCMIQTIGGDELYGECLLQKILVFEAVFGRGAEFKESAARFIEWFDKLGTGSTNYQTLKQARDILLSFAQSQVDNPPPR